MKFSIITVTYNSAETIRATIESVLNQRHVHIEYLIIDGQSNDGTLGIVEEYKAQIAKVVSEPDGGIYDAMNKGIALATGDVIGILNSDDVYAHEYVLHQIQQTFEDEQVDSVYGDLKYVRPDDLSQTVRYWKSGNFSKRKFLYGWMPPHPTFYVKRAIYEKHGVFDVAFRSAADYELMLRFLIKYKLSTAYIPDVFVLMRTGGQSNASLKNQLFANQEDRRAWAHNGLKSLPFTTFLKPIRKIPQFFVQG